MQFYFIRHAQSANNLLWEQTGSSIGRNEDPELTHLGQRQAQVLADFLVATGPEAHGNEWDPQNRSGFGFTHLYTSLMLRSVITGTIISKAIQLPLVAWPDWHEVGGIYLDNEDTGEPDGLPGKNRAYFEEYFPDLNLPDELDNAGWWDRSYETRLQRRERASRVIAELWRRHGGTHDRVAVISHGGFYNYFLSTLFNIPWNEADLEVLLENPQTFPKGRWFLMNNAAITRLDFENEVRLTYHNRVDFLPAEMIT